MLKKIFLLLLFLPFLNFNSYSIKTSRIQNTINSVSSRDSLNFFEKGSPIALVGDLQKTTIWELMIGREQNEPERIRIIKNIASDNPVSVILLGDMVSDGSEVKEWTYLHNLLKPLTNKGIPIIPVLGNHEYWGTKGTAMKNAEQNFPVFRKSHWYYKIYGSIVFIILDSNRFDLPDDAWTTQRKWFEESLKDFDSNPGIKGIIVCLHHPPYTNSLVTGDDINVQDAFVEPFLNSQKSLAMISGHAHTYERFQKRGKMFIVSGGGGGPRVPLKTGLNVHKDLVNLPSPRPFNYLLLYINPDGIEITAEGLNKGESQFNNIDDFSIHFNGIYQDTR
jgi:Icc-related predicted phosphoesterase